MEPKDYGDMVQEMEDGATLVLREVELSPGILSWLCLDCRAAWDLMMFKHKEYNKYEKIKFQLRFWEDMCRALGEGELDEGLKLLEQVSTQLIVMHKIGLEFLSAFE